MGLGLCRGRDRGRRGSRLGEPVGGGRRHDPPCPAMGGASADCSRWPRTASGTGSAGPSRRPPGWSNSSPSCGSSRTGSPGRRTAEQCDPADLRGRTETARRPVPMPRADVRRRVESSVDDLDDAIRLLRQAIFGLESRWTASACGSGTATVRRPVAGTRDHIRRAGGRCPARGGKRSAARHAADGPRADQPGCRADVGGPAGRRRPDRRRDRNRPGPAPGRQRRARAGLLPPVRPGEPGRHRDRLGPAEGGTRLAWSVPVLDGPPPADRR